jgi:hypothetical protein
VDAKGFAFSPCVTHFHRSVLPTSIASKAVLHHSARELVHSFSERSIRGRSIRTIDAEVSNKRAVMRENDSRSGGGLEEMTRNLEITGLQTNRTSRVWSKRTHVAR